MMKYMKLIAVVCAAAWAVASTPESYAGPRKRAKEGKEQTVRKTPYEKLFDGRKHTTAVGELVTLHKIDGKVFFEIPLASMGRDMLLGTTPASTMYVRGCVAGLRQQAPMHVAFNLEDSTVVLVRRNDAWLRKGVSERVGTAVAAVGCDNIVGQYRIKVCNDDRTAVVIDATELFCTDIPELSPIGEGYDPFDISAVMKTGLTRVTDVRSLNGELYVCTSTQYSVSEWRFIFPVAVNLPVDVDVVFSLVPMPEESMRPRPADDRIGLFTIEKKVLSEEGGPVGEVKYAARWNIVPADTAAYLRGELTDPVRPITMYMDPNMPETWREPVKRGILSWNRAFEKAGFREVIRVEDFPKDDPAFNPYGINTSCVWYAPSNIENAEGHFWTDPRTGEIRGATMVLHQHVAAKINRWRFVQTAQIDPRVRNVVMPREVMDESLAYVAAHEMGHCLGLAHNMAGSSAIPVDSLRSATFTQKYGTTASIMDYARFNYVAQPGDFERGVRMTPPRFGVYDRFLVKWNYTPLFAGSPEAEYAITSQWLREASADPALRYGKQQFSEPLDPRSLSEDLGDDHVRASEYGISNLKYVLSHLNAWTESDDRDYSYRKTIYNGIVNQYFTYLNHVYADVGGVYLYEKHVGDSVEHYRSVPRERQVRALEFLLGQLDDMEWLDDRSVTGNLGLVASAADAVCEAVMKAVVASPSKVGLSAALAENDAFTPEACMSLIYDRIWAPTLRRKALNLSQIKRQRLFLETLGKVAALREEGNSKSLAAMRRMEVPEAFRTDRSLLPNASAGCPGTVAGYDDPMPLFYEERPMEGLAYDCVLKIRRLLEGQRNHPDPQTRLHYRSLLHTIESYLK